MAETETEVIVAEPPRTSPAHLAQRLRDYTTSRELMIQFVSSKLVAGTDYMLIHRNLRGQPCPNKTTQDTGQCPKCKAKSTLCKPGAEKIAGLLDLVPRFRRDMETWEMFGSEAGMVAYVCELQTPDGAVVAEGRGVRRLSQDGDDGNKTVKMCQKSAQIDAVLRCAGLSEIFTLDLDDQTPQTAAEDAEKEFPRLVLKKPTPPESSSGQCNSDTTAAGARVGASARGAVISPTQHRKLEAAISEYMAAHPGEEDTRAKIKDACGRMFGVEHFPELTEPQYEQVMGWINKKWMQRAAETEQ